MSKQKTKINKDKPVRRSKNRSRVMLKLLEEQPDSIASVRLPQYSGMAVASDGDIEGQTARLGDSRLQVAQRQALAAQIGQLGGNQYLQRIVSSLRADEKEKSLNAEEDLTSAVQNQETAPGTENSVVQRFKMSAGDRRTYPKFKTFVRRQMPRTANDERITRNLDEYGTNTFSIFGFTLRRRNPANDVAWNNGPTINVTSLSGANGEFSPGIGSDELRINDAIVDAYENETDTSKIPAHELLLESTILHEYTHYLDDQDSTDRPGEEGQAFEEATYGIDIDSVADAEDVLNARFGSGMWDVTVEAKEASFAQRLIISGAARGNGTYPGVVGTSVMVSGPPRGQWTIVIEHNNGRRGWKPSKTHKVRESRDNFLIRSEDWSDRDMDDLTLRVRKLPVGDFSSPSGGSRFA